MNYSISASPISGNNIGHAHQKASKMLTPKRVNDVIEKYISKDLLKKVPKNGKLQKIVENLHCIACREINLHAINNKLGNRCQYLLQELLNIKYSIQAETNFIQGVGVSDDLLKKCIMDESWKSRDTKNKTAKNSKKSKKSKSKKKASLNILLTTIDTAELSGYLTTWVQRKKKSKEKIVPQDLIDLKKICKDRGLLEPTKKIITKEIDLYIPGFCIEMKNGGQVDTGKAESTIIKDFLIPYMCIEEASPYYFLLSKTDKKSQIENLLDRELLLLEEEFFQLFLPELDYEDFLAKIETVIAKHKSI